VPRATCQRPDRVDSATRERENILHYGRRQNNHPTAQIQDVNSTATCFSRIEVRNPGMLASAADCDRDAPPPPTNDNDNDDYTRDKGDDVGCNATDQPAEDARAVVDEVRAAVVACVA
jgi:hypothetical protein